MENLAKKNWKSCTILYNPLIKLWKENLYLRLTWVSIFFLQHSGNTYLCIGRYSRIAAAKYDHPAPNMLFLHFLCHEK